ncbi:hypothetical protein BDN70DRAFT_899113 [Pholiota conissans]|uniref:Uncharacterized protein n=1 Tax=Pholiota conissans TaxID=109636 RepID=A0A9P5YSG3_9AGAR|nr:hypothetical protein BDN70DRAFT_899113 [Pholiota conissans]
MQLTPSFILAAMFALKATSVIATPMVSEPAGDIEARDVAPFETEFEAREFDEDFDLEARGFDNELDLEARELDEMLDLDARAFDDAVEVEERDFEGFENIEARKFAFLGKFGSAVTSKKPSTATRATSRASSGRTAPRVGGANSHPGAARLRAGVPHRRLGGAHVQHKLGRTGATASRGTRTGTGHFSHFTRPSRFATNMRSEKSQIRKEANEIHSVKNKLRKQGTAIHLQEQIHRDSLRLHQTGAVF